MPRHTVIGHPQSRAFRVLWTLEELGLDYDHVPAKPNSPEARAASPGGKIPALRVEEDGRAHTLTDSVAIMTHLADRHGALTHPAGTPERARQDAAVHLVLCELEAPIWSLAKHAFVLPQERRVPAVKESLRWEASRAEAALAERLGEAEFLAGPFTIADILAAHTVGWGAGAKVPSGSDRLRAWAAALSERPAAARARERAAERLAAAG